jgi:hypothetical protein
MNKWLTIFLFLLTGSYGIAQDITITASAPEVVAVGEQFRLSFTANANIEELTPPDLSDFYVLMGPSTSYNQSTQIVNNKMTRTISYTYTYVIQATKEGQFTIGPATARIKNKTYPSNPIEIEVVEGVQPAGDQGIDPATGIPTPGASSEDLFLRIHVNKSSVYQGEHIIATIKIYSRVNLSGFENAKFPAFNGFLREDIETPPLRSLERENISGVIYGTGVLQRIVLFPQITGELVIDPMELECLVQQRVRQNNRDFFDDFFSSYQNVKQTIKSLPVKIDVKPPPENAPDGFTGSTGQLSMDVRLDKEQMIENEALNLRIRFNGNGNLKLIEVPEVDFPPDFDVYDPKVSTNLTNTIAGISGTKTFDILAIPRHAGSYRIPPVEFVYFDPAEETYKTIRSEEFSIVVDKDKESEEGAVISGFSKEDLRFIGSDIRFIKNENFQLRRKEHTFFGTLPFYLSYVASLIAFGLIIFIRRKQIRRNANHELVRNRKAKRIAEKRLRQAYRYLKAGENSRFYEELLKSFWGYLGDKLTIPVSDLSSESAKQVLMENKVDDKLIEEFFEIIEHCEFARFAPSDEVSEALPVYDKASRIITKFEQNLK